MKTDLTPIKESWMKGYCVPALFHPVSVLFHAVQDARGSLKGLSEKAARKIWDVLETVFELWKLRLGETPTRRVRGLLDSGTDVSFDDAPPYDCAGPGIGLYADLLLKLKADNYEPLSRLLEVVPLRALLAVLTLREAAAENVEGALSAHRQLDRLENTELRVDIELLRPHAKLGIKQIESARKGAQEHATSAETVQGWQAAANEIWKHNIRLSYRQVARRVGKQLGGKPETIRRKIRKPSRVG